MTDDDVKNVKYVYEAAGSTLEGLRRWSGYSTGALKRWLGADKYETEWRQSVKKHFEKMAADLSPEPVAAAPRVPAFLGSDVRIQALDLAISLRGKDGELSALRLAVDLMRGDA